MSYSTELDYLQNVLNVVLNIYCVHHDHVIMINVHHTTPPGFKVMQMYYGLIRLFTIHEYASVTGQTKDALLARYSEEVFRELDGVYFGFICYDNVVESVWHGIGKWQN